MMLNGGSKTCCGTGMGVFLFEVVIPGCALWGAGPESILTMVVMDSGLASSTRPGMTGALNSQSLNPVRASCERDVLGLHVEVERIVAAVAADAGRLHAAERCRQMADVLRIEP